MANKAHPFVHLFKKVDSSSSNERWEEHECAYCSMTCIAHVSDPKKTFDAANKKVPCTGPNKAAAK